MKYRVHGHITISVMVDVEAENDDEAREKANEAGVATLCNGCATNNGSTEEWCAEELDGEPTVTSVEVIE